MQFIDKSSSDKSIKWSGIDWNAAFVIKINEIHLF